MRQRREQGAHAGASDGDLGPPGILHLGDPQNPVPHPPILPASGTGDIAFPQRASPKRSPRLRLTARGGAAEQGFGPSAPACPVPGGSVPSPPYRP
ncbi:hypothetical protein GCM10011579_039940 [Streptomyces albiflavescens]|uniref:Uncharacterized protein n=1 Tax=Streptomyces albiflavescens TaxID=1623582 RepID=A0A917Y5I1_9ACTN|nr:hypothetical protein GCM10011579_039940 [Streptomyces albiflavescens]